MKKAKILTKSKVVKTINVWPDTITDLVWGMMGPVLKAQRDTDHLYYTEQIKEIK